MTAIELAASYEAAREIGPWLSATLEQLGAPQLARVGELELAIHEVAINIVDHAYDDVSRPHATYSIELCRNDDDVVVAAFRDQGSTFTDDHLPPSDEPTVRGYGLMIAEQLATSVSYERRADVNHWTLAFAP